MNMDLQPYGPIDQAFQKSDSIDLLQPNDNSKLWLGVGIGLTVCVIIWWIKIEGDKRRNRWEKIN